VESPDAVVVDGNSRRHRSQTVEVRLDPADVGRVIGKGGKNIEAIRAVVKAAAIKDHTRVNVEVVTDDQDEDGEQDLQDRRAFGESVGGAEEMSEAADRSPGAAEAPMAQEQGDDHEGHDHNADDHQGASVPEIVEG